MILGAVLLLIMAPPRLDLATRNRPEDHGLLPDGARGPESRPGQATGLGTVAIPVAEEIGRAEAMRTPIFWPFYWGCRSRCWAPSITFPYRQHLRRQRHERGAGGLAFVPVAITTAITNLGSGFLVDRVRLR
ncbi:MAG: hypothetical protein R2932_34740 [Caldilineaceae bacterium]